MCQVLENYPAVGNAQEAHLSLDVSNPRAGLLITGLGVRGRWKRRKCLLKWDEVVGFRS